MSDGRRLLQQDRRDADRHHRAADRRHMSENADRLRGGEAGRQGEIARQPRVPDDQGLLACWTGQADLPVAGWVDRGSRERRAAESRLQRCVGAAGVRFRRGS